MVLQLSAQTGQWIVQSSLVGRKGQRVLVLLVAQPTNIAAHLSTLPVAARWCMRMPGFVHVSKWMDGEHTHKGIHTRL